MSFEGYSKFLCERGHLHQMDVFADENPFNQWAEDDAVAKWRCYCAAGLAWWCTVDQTNCEVDEETGLEPGDVQLEIDKPAVTHTCNFGHAHTIEEETYKIPAKGGHTPRTWWCRRQS